MIIDHYQINKHDKDYKVIKDLNNVTLRGDDVLGFITKWDDVLMRSDQTKLPSDEQQLLLLERQIVNSMSFTINYATIHVATVQTKLPKNIASRHDNAQLPLPTGRNHLLALADI